MVPIRGRKSRRPIPAVAAAGLFCCCLVFVLSACSAGQDATAQTAPPASSRSAATTGGGLVKEPEWVPLPTMDRRQSLNWDLAPGKTEMVLSVAVPQGQSPLSGQMVWLLVNSEGRTFVGDGAGLHPLVARVELNTAGKIIAAPGFTLLTARQVNTLPSGNYVPLSNGQRLLMVGLSGAYVAVDTTTTSSG